MTKNANYDFIICDLNMPVMDGYECAIKIKDFYKNSNQIFEVSKNN
jgi:CheY-like chemotaxis protein